METAAVIGGHAAACRPETPARCTRPGVSGRSPNQDRALKEAHHPWAFTE